MTRKGLQVWKGVVKLGPIEWGRIEGGAKLNPLFKLSLAFLNPQNSMSRFLLFWVILNASMANKNGQFFLPSMPTNVFSKCGSANGYKTAQKWCGSQNLGVCWTSLSHIFLTLCLKPWCRILLFRWSFENHFWCNH